ncbi:MAG: preprotein translocase subunit YajC, partial [Clostridiales bacterium]|nr:preprotein translocase subunit YajC [Clostridiales bacterium]
IYNTKVIIKENSVMVSFSLLNAIDPTTIIFIVLLALLIIALLVVPMFTNKKRARQTDELHRSLKPGDLIKTVGGVVGTIIEIRQISPVDKEMVIETGVEGRKTTMVFDIQALYQVMSRSSTIVHANDEPETENEVAEGEQPTPETEQPQRVVPDILADRIAQAEATDAPAQDTVSEQAEAPATEPKAEQNETPAEKPAPKKAPAKKSGNGNKKTSK